MKIIIEFIVGWIIVIIGFAVYRLYKNSLITKIEAPDSDFKKKAKMDFFNYPDKVLAEAANDYLLVQISENADIMNAKYSQVISSRINIKFWEKIDLLEIYNSGENYLFEKPMNINRIMDSIINSEIKEYNLSADDYILSSED
jgi:hypothetical protein